MSIADTSQLRDKTEEWDMRTPPLEYNPVGRLSHDTRAPYKGTPYEGPAPRMPTDSGVRKEMPIGTGVLDYFPDALAAVAGVSYKGNQQHNPGQPLGWSRGKSMDHSDCIVRHFMERGTIDIDGMQHSAKLAWRALALLQEEIERDRGLPPSRGSRTV